MPPGVSMRERNEQRRAEWKKQQTSSLTTKERRKQEQIGAFIEYAMQRGPAPGAKKNTFRAAAETKVLKRPGTTVEGAEAGRAEGQGRGRGEGGGGGGGGGGERRAPEVVGDSESLTLSSMPRNPEKGIVAFLAASDLESSALRDPEAFLMAALGILVRDSRCFCNKDLEKFNQVLQKEQRRSGGKKFSPAFKKALEESLNMQFDLMIESLLARQ